MTAKLDELVEFLKDWKTAQKMHNEQQKMHNEQQKIHNEQQKNHNDITLTILNEISTTLKEMNDTNRNLQTQFILSITNLASANLASQNIILNNNNKYNLKKIDDAIIELKGSNRDTKNY